MGKNFLGLCPGTGQGRVSARELDAVQWSDMVEAAMTREAAVTLSDPFVMGVDVARVWG